MYTQAWPPWVTVKSFHLSHEGEVYVMGEDSPAPGTIFSVKLFCFCLILTVQLHFCCTCSVESPVASASHITRPQHPDCTGAAWSRQEIWHLSLSRTILIESALVLHIFKRKVCQTERSLAVVSGLCSETGRPDEAGFILSLCCHGSLVASRLFRTSQTLQHKF